MANGQVPGFLDDAAEVLGPSPTSLQQTSKLPRFLRSPIVLSSKTAARVRPAGWMLYDAAVSVCALTIGYTMTPRAVGLTPPPAGLAAFALCVIVGGNIARLYDRQMLLKRTNLFLSLLLTTAIAIAGIALFTNLIVYKQIGRWILLITAVTFLAAAAAPRLAGHCAAHLHPLRVLLVGDRASASPVAQRLRRENGYHVLMGFCSDKMAAIHGAVGRIEDIPRVCAQLRIDEVVITHGYMNRPDVLDRCFQAIQSGCRVLDEATFHEEVFEEVPVEQIREGWFYGAKLGGASPFHVGLKRALDVFVSAAALLVLLPLLALLWALVRLTSQGPAIYRQVRCGQFGKPFTLYKFRTMSLDAEANGACWAKDRDPRATPVGRLLRKTRLDEIPQFWNVLKGDMSFVGPRPERPELTEEIGKSVPYFAFRHLVRPGITGLAQIRFQYGASVEDARRKLQHDLYYIKNWSVLLDVLILLRTVSAIMKGSR